jgi:hypothetical protein
MQLYANKQANRNDYLHFFKKKEMFHGNFC